MTDETTHPQFCIFTRRGVAIILILFCLGGGISSAIRAATGRYLESESWAVIAGMLVAVVVGVAIAARGHCRSERLFGLLLTVVIALKLMALLLGRPILFEIQLVLQAVACFVVAAIIVFVLVRQRQALPTQS